MSLDLNYKPNVFVETASLTEDEWLAWRRKGVGGSDVAAALGLSPYRTARELYYDKIGVVPAVEGEDKSITFEIGHLLEDVVAKIFAKKTGLSVYRDQKMFQHPLFPFMLADVDRFIHLPNGDTGILECKTAHYDTQYLWANGAVPRHYELQVKHYMAVMNIDVAYIACLFSNSESDFVWRKIERDLDEEENNILLLQNFWNRYVLNRVEPPLTEKPDMVLAALSRYYGPADKNAPTVTVGAEFAPALEQLLAMKAQKKDLDAQSRKLDEQIKRTYAPIAELMGAACGAVCESNGIKYNISFAPQYREGISKDNLSKLRAQYPDAYDDLVQTTESRIFKLTILECLDEGEYFIPHLVGLPEKRFDTFDPQVDHPYFELSEDSFVETMESETVEVQVDELVSAFLSCKGKWEQIDPDRTMELLNILIDEKVNDEGGHGYRVVERLVELGFSKKELMVLKFAESDIDRAMQEGKENV